MRYFLLSAFAFFAVACNRSGFRERWVRKPAPPEYDARMQTSKGVIDIHFTRALSPQAADRVYAQLKHRYYDHTLFYRVNSHYAQFGGDDSVRSARWGKVIVKDEPVLAPNDRGTVSFARSGSDSRSNDLFINLKDNRKLDTVSYSGVKGFPAFGKVTRGMAVADALYARYEDSVFKDYELLFRNKALFLEHYPKLDSILTFRLIRR